MPHEKTRCGNLLIDFYDRLPAVIAHIVRDPSPIDDPVRFSPGFALPELDDRAPGVLRGRRGPLGAARRVRRSPVHHARPHGQSGDPDHEDLRVLLIVARAVEHIRRTGRSVMIVSPTSGNKGVALRDAVLRALDAGLATPEQLRVVILAPSDSLPKLRASRLSTDSELRALNPQLVYPGKEPEAVKALAREFVHDHAARLSAGGLDVWFSLELANYMVADATRALFEHRVDPIEGRGSTRTRCRPPSACSATTRAGNCWRRRGGPGRPPTGQPAGAAPGDSGHGAVTAFRLGRRVAPAVVHNGRFHRDVRAGRRRPAVPGDHLPPGRGARRDVLHPPAGHLAGDERDHRPVRG